MSSQRPRLVAKLCNVQSNPALVREFQEFRKRLFVDTLQWDLAVFGNLEIDQFDGATATYCAIYADDKLISGFRAIRCDHEYLALSVFPQLATERPYPRAPDMWEISRLGVQPPDLNVAGVTYAVMLHLAQQRGAKALVALVDLCHERLLRQIGIKTRRYGSPQYIGDDRRGRRLTAVAGEIPILEQGGEAYEALMDLLQTIEIIDETLVFRREAVQSGPATVLPDAGRVGDRSAGEAASWAKAGLVSNRS
ncbi:acyl-homoserine-lactone synthase [Hyphomicrobium sp.]|uniref:acyl-homoserine-lactone synthase n=1 Tax=Hyphomicrobium sp. TaxID=82 RepID=UPI002D78D82B|nr:acyl-homoserine-lactone synthase [Hyphomicrobium sp.]HET6388300.1 acyl-homoserine-lactone synthase [Hyphomicrobium sp.]